MVTVTHAFIDAKTGQVEYKQVEKDITSEPLTTLAKPKLTKLLELLKDKGIISEEEKNGI